MRQEYHVALIVTAAAAVVAAAYGVSPEAATQPPAPVPTGPVDEIPVFDPRCVNDTMTYLDVDGHVLIDGDLDLGTVAEVLRRSWRRALEVAARAVEKPDVGPRLIDTLPLTDVQKAKVEDLARGKPGDLPPGDPLRGEALETAKRRVAFANEALQPLQRKRAGDAPRKERDQASIVFLGDNTSFLWVGGEIPFTVDLGTPAAALIPDAMKLWNTKTHNRIRFVPRDPVRHHDYVRFRRGRWCQSDGVGRLMGEQTVTLNENTGPPQLVHELGHVIGLFHEHNRRDRGSKIEFHGENALRGYGEQFERSAVLGEDKALDRGVFDWDSVMLYPPFAFNKDGAQTLVRLDPPGRRGDTRWGLLSPGNYGGVTTEPSVGDATAVRNLYVPLLSKPPGAPPPPR